MRKSSVYKLAISTAVAAIMVGCIGQSTYRKDREMDADVHSSDMDELNSKLDNTQKENAVLQKEIKRIRDMKVGIPAEAVMRVEQSLTETVINFSKLVNRTDRRARSDFDERLVADFESSDNRSKAARDELEGRLADSIGGTNSDLDGLYDDHDFTTDMLLEGIAYVDSRSNTARGKLEGRLGTRINSGDKISQTNVESLSAHNTRLQALNTAMEKLQTESKTAKEEYKTAKADYDTNVSTYKTKIEELQLQVKELQKTKVIVPPTPGVPNDPKNGAARNPALTTQQLKEARKQQDHQELVEMPEWRDLYICIVGRKFRYFSRHVARIPSADIVSVLDPANAYMNQETAAEIISLLSRNDEFTTVRNRVQLTTMLSSSTPTPIVEISREYLENICNDKKLKMVDKGLINRNSIATFNYILGRTGGSKNPTFYLTARNPSELGRR